MLVKNKTKQKTNKTMKALRIWCWSKRNINADYLPKGKEKNLTINSIHYPTGFDETIV